MVNKFKFCTKLGDSHKDLALYFEIPPRDQNRWPAGSECEKILEWLENRSRFDELPEALVEIKREDLVYLISQPANGEEENRWWQDNEGGQLFARESFQTNNIKQSFKLNKKEKEYFHSLFIFSADLDIPFSVIAIIWDLELSEVKPLCDKLYELSLLRKYKTTDDNRGIIQLNSLLRKHFISVSDNEFKQLLAKTNKKFVEYYEKKYELNSPDYLPDNLPLEEKKFLRKVYKYHWRQAKKV
ncbi:hypothetical protein [Okeania sp. SIO2B3]|uniref:hypothetical protein n=1 Tax=Okeania sp. SIO2B3 TaxID=2607784 RepID=UPI0013BF13C2|nr:hypothetical protein [Okeania sp. SIO2B3]NET43318.1 hypothetical protein [Okeania sp. SIO2B3]